MPSTVNTPAAELLPLSAGVPVAQPHPELSGKTILVVDDTPANLAVIGDILKSSYHIRVANSGERALRAAMTSPRPDLILLDVMMPDMDGYTVLERLKHNPVTRDIPVIFVTAMDADEDETYGFKLGAVDYIVKPVRAAVLQARVRTHLELLLARKQLQSQNDYLEWEVAQRLRENELIKDVSLYALALLAETRDPDTGNHLRRTQAYVSVLARYLAKTPRFAAQLDENSCTMIVKAAPLHDIGKVGIPDHILLKQGKLTTDEFAVMQTHSRIGGDSIAVAMRRVERDFSLQINDSGEYASLAFMEIARQIALWHHEKWDGSGYPDGLAGEAIPLPARLMALADVYDALSVERSYKPALPIDEVEAILREGRGRHFDPDILDAYFEVRDEFLDIARHFQNQPT